MKKEGGRGKEGKTTCPSDPIFILTMRFVAGTVVAQGFTSGVTITFDPTQYARSPTIVLSCTLASQKSEYLRIAFPFLTFF